MRGNHSYYEIVNVPRGATAEDVRAAYRRLLRTCHPDLGGSPALFDLLNEAFAVLSDPVRRAAYDAEHPDPTPVTSGAVETAHAGDDYAALRRSRSSIWRSQRAFTDASDPGPTRLAALYL